MGIGSFVRGKMNKHGGAVGLAKAVVTKPLRMARGGSDSDRDSRGDGSAMPTGVDAEGYRAVGRAELVKTGKPGTYVVDGAAVSVFRLDDGALVSIDDACVHEDGPLGEGTVSGNVVTCAYHNWRYDLVSGECLSEKDRWLATYAVREKDGFVWIGKRTREPCPHRGGQHDDGLNTLVLPADH